MDWLIAVPAWGDRCIHAFLSVTMPAIKVALYPIKGRVRFLIHTDRPEQVRLPLRDLEHELRPVPKGDNAHHSLGHANRDALAAARVGEVIALINADMVGSVEMFTASERRLQEGKRVVVITGTRTLSNELPPIGATSRDLLQWGWARRHPWIYGTTWGEGKTETPSILHFVSGSTVVMHGFHLHPFAILKKKELGFGGVTTDQDLLDNFPRSDIHVVKSADEFSFVEMSPREREFGESSHVIDVPTIAAWAARQNKTTPMHRWLFTHRICLCGDDRDVGDAAVCAEILTAVENWREPSTAAARVRSMMGRRRRRRR